MDQPGRRRRAGHVRRPGDPHRGRPRARPPGPGRAHGAHAEGAPRRCPAAGSLLPQRKRGRAAVARRHRRRACQCGNCRGRRPARQRHHRRAGNRSAGRARPCRRGGARAAGTLVSFDVNHRATLSSDRPPRPCSPDSSVKPTWCSPGPDRQTLAPRSARPGSTPTTLPGRRDRSPANWPNAGPPTVVVKLGELGALSLAIGATDIHTAPAEPPRGPSDRPGRRRRRIRRGLPQREVVVQRFRNRIA